MRWQINKEEAVIHCDPCRRAVIVSDWKGTHDPLLSEYSKWDSDTEFLSKKPSDD